MSPATPLRAPIAISFAVLFAACGGTVVYENDGGTGGNGSGGAGNHGQGANGSGGGIVDTGNGGDAVTTTNVTTTNVATTNVTAAVGQSVGQGGSPDTVAVGPGPGPGGGGFDPTGAGGEGTGPGPSGVGGADVGPQGAVSVTSGGGGDNCASSLSETNQYCYAIDSCRSYTLEVECELNGGSPYTCWCYQDSQFVGSCDESERPFCSSDICCSAFWVLPG